MCLHLVLPQLEPSALTLPSRCPASRCDGTEFRLHQQVVKALNDARHHVVVVRRYRCCRCGHTFRVYPRGVTHAQTSRWVQQIAVLLYRLGLSYAMVSSALEVFGVYLCKSRVYDAVRVAQTDGLRSGEAVFEAIQRRHYQGALLHVRCMGHWLPLALSTDQCSELVLSVSALSSVEIATLHDQITPLVTAVSGHVVLDTGDDERVQGIHHGTV